MNMQKQYFQVNEHLAQGKVVKLLPDGLTDMMQSSLRYSIKTTVLNFTQIYSKSLIDCLSILNSCPHITIHKPNVSLSAKTEFPTLHSFKCSWNTNDLDIYCNNLLRASKTTRQTSIRLSPFMLLTEREKLLAYVHRIFAKRAFGSHYGLLIFWKVNKNVNEKPQLPAIATFTEIILW